MAKRKKGRRRSRRVGAVSLGGKKGTGLKLLAVAGGFLMGDMINTQVDKILPKTKNADGTETPNNTVGIVGQLGIGGLLLLKKKQNMLTTIGGGVLAGAGLKRALKTMGVLKGYQSVPVIGRHRMSGYQSVPVIGNSGMPPQLSGRTPAQLQGYRVNGYTAQGSGMGVLAGDGGSGITNTNSSGYMG
jgi:hypothetical protein